MPRSSLERATRALGACALLCAACSAQSQHAPSEHTPAYEPLVELSAWQGLSPDEDPFVTDPLGLPECSGPGYYVEEDFHWLELDTTECSWVTLEAGAEADVAVGQSLRIVVSHYDLNAPEPAQAQLKLTLGGSGCVAWSKSVDIPSPAAVYTESFASPCRLDAHESVRFHLNNHGQNTWQLQELAILR